MLWYDVLCLGTMPSPYTQHTQEHVTTNMVDKEAMDGYKKSLEDKVWCLCVSMSLCWIKEQCEGGVAEETIVSGKSPKLWYKNKCAIETVKIKRRVLRSCTNSLK